MLAAIGVYGVLAYTVAQARHDIGVRMALGARRGHILRHFLSYGMKWAAWGGCTGLVAALMPVRFMRSMLFQVTPYDPKSFLTGTAVLSVVILSGLLHPRAQSNSGRSADSIEERIITRVVSSA